MNKKVALVTLIESSLLLTADDKLALIDRVPTLNEKQVDTIGKFLALERQVILEHKDELNLQFARMISELEKEAPDAVYVGSGKPS